MLNGRMDSLQKGDRPEGAALVVAADAGLGLSTLMWRTFQRHDNDDAPFGTNLRVGAVSAWTGAQVMTEPAMMLDFILRCLHTQDSVPSRPSTFGVDVGDISTPADLEQALEASTASDWWQGRAFALLVDDLHEGTTNCMETVRILADGNHGCPTTVVGFGDLSVENMLDQCDYGPVSVKERMELAPLTPEQTKAAVVGCLDSWHLADRVPDECVDMIADATQGNPRSIELQCNGLKAALIEHKRLSSMELVVKAAAFTERHKDHRTPDFYQKLVTVERAHSDHYRER